MTILSQKSSQIFLSVLFLVLSIWAFGHTQLGGFDASALVDTSWRMANGQTPYKEFPVTTPVAFYVGGGWALQLFGIKWSSFVIAAIIFTVFSFLTQLYLLNLIIPWKPALAISFICHLLCSVVISYWWYNSTMMNAVCLFLSAAYVFANQPNKRMSAILLWATLTLLSFMKPNIAGGLAIVVFIALLGFSSYRGRLVLIGAAGLFSFVVILLLLKISPFDVIQNYLAIGKTRAEPSILWFYNDKSYEFLVVVPLILLSLLPMLERISKFNSRKNTPVMRINLAITIASILVGVLSLVTNSDSNLVVGIPFFLLGSIVFYFLTETDKVLPAPRKLWRHAAIFFILVTIVGNIIVQANYHAQDSMPNMLAPWFIMTILCGIAAVLILLPGDNPKISILPLIEPRTGLVWASLLVCCSIAIFASGMRWRISYIGYEAFFTYSPLTNVEGISFFENFRVSPRAKSTLLEIQRVLQKNYGESQDNWKDASVYFGTRIEFAYAAFGISSPRNLPVWWHPNNSYAPEREPEYVQSFFDHHFSDAIFMKFPETDVPDFGFLPKKVVADFIINYDRIDYPNIVLFHKK